MRDLQFMIERNQSYFQQPETNCFCSGNKSECSELEEEGYTIIDWKADSSDLEIEKIKLLHLVPTKAQIKKGVLPDFVADLKYLENIVFDISFIRNLDENQLPQSLRSIMLTRNLRYDDIIDALIENPVTLREGLSFKNLEALKIIGGKEKTGVLKTISADVFPSLKFLGFDISEKSELESIKRFSNLSDIQLLYLKDYEIFDYLEHLPVISLDLGGTNNKFDFPSIKVLKKLKFISLNSIRAEIDCSIFKEFPDLIELDIMNSKKILNIESLLEIKTLVSLSFLDCNNPFKKGIAEKFHSRKYEILDIKYA